MPVNIKRSCKIWLRTMGWITYTTIHFIWPYKEPRNIKFYQLLKLVRKLVSTIEN